MGHEEGEKKWKEEEWEGAGPDPRATDDTGVPGTSSPRWVLGGKRSGGWLIGRGRLEPVQQSGASSSSQQPRSTFIQATS